MIATVNVNYTDLKNKNDLDVIYNNNNEIIQKDLSKGRSFLDEKYVNDDKTVTELLNPSLLMTKPSESFIIDKNIENNNIKEDLSSIDKIRKKQEKKFNEDRANEIAQKAMEEAKKAKEEAERKAKEEAERKAQEEIQRKAKEKVNKREPISKDNVETDLKVDKNVNYKKKIKVELTGYSDKMTASGAIPKIGTIASPPQVPFGTKIYIPGWGTFTTEDRGGAIKIKADGTYKIDIWRATEEEAENVGLVKAEAYILE
ncbi:3D domain-containing protein [Clostridium perfringens]|uniref:3D domain-containing protein n=1 Tax=Clostridium perfringens TaxID=1502 RepID=UPI0039EBFF29